ncbi:MAG: LemA family protein [Rhizobiaceae bacterium]|nr:LemA family protein [Rhizobiaceae bacterium]
MTVTLIALVVLVLGFVVIQNRLASAQNAVYSGFSTIEVQLKRRHDLVPALVSSVRSAITQENKLFDTILAVREKAVQAVGQGKLDEMKEAESELSASLRTFFGYAEDHPEVTSTTNILELQKQLEEAEDQISAARRLYNGNVQRFNTMLDAIPSNWVAGLLRMKKAEFFALSDSEAKAAQTMPKIELPGAQG